MDKVEQLLIRACRSLNPRQRLLSVYRHFYNADTKLEDREFYLSNILLGIVEKYNTLTIRRLINDINPKSAYFWKLDDDTTPYNERVYKTLISSIRLAHIKKFKGLTPPLRFRK